MRHLYPRIALAMVVTLGFLLAGETSAHAQEGTLAELLESGEITYGERDGIYKIFLESGERSAMVTAREVTLYENQAGEEVKVVYLWTPVLQIPDGIQAPAGMLSKMAELNDRVFVGKLSMSGGGVYYCSAFWLKTATPEILNDELSLAFFTVPDFRKELEPYLEEE